MHARILPIALAALAAAMLTGCSDGPGSVAAPVDAAAADVETPDVSGLDTHVADAAHCDDGALSGDETDIDCGGSCGPCSDGEACAAGVDCHSGVCDGAHCVAEAICGNGVVETGELCDGDCPASCAAPSACMDVELVGSASTCDATCVGAPITACSDGDGCCPAGCASSDDDCFSLRVDGGIESGTESLYGGVGFVPLIDYLSAGDARNSSMAAIDPDYVVGGTGYPQLYRTEMWVSGDSATFTFPVPAGDYDLHLHFVDWAPGTISEPGDRVFDVSVDDELLFDDVDIIAEVGSAAAYVLSAPVTAGDGGVTVTLDAVVGPPEICGVELVAPGTPPLGEDPVVTEVPAAPSDLLATVRSSSQIELTWNDNADNEDAFVVEWTLDGVTQSARAARNATRYTVSGLIADSAYELAVWAENTAGRSASSTTTARTEPRSESCETPSGSPPEAYFVSPGAGGGDGTARTPFGTLEEARDAIRGLDVLPTGGVTVYLREGIYERDSSFRLTAEDAGSSDSPITYAAYPCETPRITGGPQLRGLEPIEAGPIRDRLPPEARGAVMQIDLRANGVTSVGEHVQRYTVVDGGRPIEGPSPSELFIDGEAYRLARYPNMDGAYTGWWWSTDVTSGNALGYEGDRPAERGWRSDASNPIMVRGALRFTFNDFISEVVEIDTAARVLRLDQLNGSPRADRFFYAYNILEELDEPGEYWIDPGALVLYVWPLGSGAEDVVLSQLDTPIIEVDGAHFTVFRGLSVEAGRLDGVHIVNTHDVVVADSVVRNVGQDGIANDPGEPVPAVSILRTEVANTGRDGVFLAGGVRSTLTDSQNLVEDSYIHDFGRHLNANGVAMNVYFQGSGGTIRHSHIEHGSGICVHLKGARTTVEHNVIWDCSVDTGDLGAVYWGYIDPAQRGIAIRHNLIGASRTRMREWVNFGSHPYANNCLYVDGGGSGGDVSMNLLHDCDTGTLTNGGKFHRFEHNIFSENTVARWHPCLYREPAGTYHPGVQVFIDVGVHDILRRARVSEWTDHADWWTPDISWAEQLSPYDTLEELEAMIGHAPGYQTTGEFIGNVSWGNGSLAAENPYTGCRWTEEGDVLVQAPPEPLFEDADGRDFHIRESATVRGLIGDFPVDAWNAMIDEAGPRD